MSKLIKLRFLKSVRGAPFFLSYQAGSYGHVRPELVDDLVKGGFAEKVEQPKPKTETKTAATKPKGRKKKSA